MIDSSLVKLSEVIQIEKRQIQTLSCLCNGCVSVCVQLHARVDLRVMVYAHLFYVYACVCEREKGAGVGGRGEYCFCIFPFFVFN